MTNVLPAAEVAAMQDAIATTFNTSIVVAAQVRTSDGRGGYSLAWTNVVLSVAARRTDLTGQEQLIAQQVKNTQMKRFHILATSVALDTSMRLTDSETNTVYNIRDISTPGPVAITTTFLCEFITGSVGA